MPVPLLFDLSLLFRSHSVLSEPAPPMLNLVI